MPLTFGQISDKVSELRSKIAIKEAFVLHLKANYKSSDAGSAEMHVTRDDFATVPEIHIDLFIEDTVDEIDTMRAELRQWESLPVPTPGEDPPKVSTRKGKKSRGTSRRHSDQSPPGDGGSEEAG